MNKIFIKAKYDYFPSIPFLNRTICKKCNFSKKGILLFTYCENCDMFIGVPAKITKIRSVILEPIKGFNKKSYKDFIEYK